MFHSFYPHIVGDCEHSLSQFQFQEKEGPLGGICGIHAAGWRNCLSHKLSTDADDKQGNGVRDEFQTVKQRQCLGERVEDD